MRSADAFRILCPSHLGPLGVETINQAVDLILHKYGIDTESQWYAGRSIIIEENDYALEVFNGDTGLCIKQEGEIFVTFSAGHETRLISPSLLPKVKTAWSLTIHRTQGSEYDHLLLVIPDGSTQARLLSREQLYTGLSRAKQSVTIWSHVEDLKQAIQHPAQRASGLANFF